MEVYRRRRTDPWIWVAIVAIVAIALLVIVWLVTAESREEARERELERQERIVRERRQEEQPDIDHTEDLDDRVIIRDQERVREIVRERPVYIYEESGQRESDSPRNIVVVPRESEDLPSNYERVDVPARFESNGREYIIQTGTPVRGDPNEFVSAGRQVDGHTVYYKKGTTEPRDTLYLRIRPDSDVYLPYELSPQ